MPIKVKDTLPAISVLENENIFVMTEHIAMKQDIRPLKVLLLNLMPTKIITETQFLRKLSNTPLQIEVEFLQTSTYTPKNVDPSHLNTFYQTFDDVKDRQFDGMIITGAPLAYIKYEDVDYWDELCEIMDWSKKNVHSVFHSCWGALAGLHHKFGINHFEYDQKLHGIYEHYKLKKNSPLFRGFDDVFYAPHSRELGIRSEDIAAIDELEIMAESDEAGFTIAKTKDSHDFFVLCHPEYDANTLKLEYERDLAAGLNPPIPKNYFPDDDLTKEPIVRWRSMGQLLFSNWLNFYVYQTTPYDIRRIHKNE